MKNLFKLLLIMLLFIASCQQKSYQTSMQKTTDKTYGICPAYNQKQKARHYKKLSRQQQKKVSTKVSWLKTWWNSF